MSKGSNKRVNEVVDDKIGGWTSRSADERMCKQEGGGMRGQAMSWILDDKMNENVDEWV